MNKDLRDDICHFYFVKNYLKRKFDSIYSESQSLSWLDIHLNNYMNKHIPFDVYILPTNVLMWKRLFIMKNKTDQFIKNFFKYNGLPSATLINIILGLMTLKERDDFIFTLWYLLD